MRMFKRGDIDVLVATEIAVRSTSMRNVKHIINYDLPKDMDHYLQRAVKMDRQVGIGRLSTILDRSV